jgi:hypothetical protein
MRQTVRAGIGIVAIIAVLFVLNLFLAQPKKRGSDWGLPTGTTYSAAPDGAEFVYRLFDDLGFDVVRLRRPLTRAFLEKSEIDVIWHASRKVPLGSDELLWVEKWVADGGSLVLLDDPRLRGLGGYERFRVENRDELVMDWLDRAGLRERIEEVRQISAQQIPGIQARRLSVDGEKIGSSLGEIDTLHTYLWQGLVNPEVCRFAPSGDVDSVTAEILARDSYGAVVVRVPHGKGEVWLLADPFMLGNMLIQETDNALLAAAIVLNSRGGDLSHVAFDEYHLGFVQTRTVFDAAGTPFGRALLYLGLVAVLAVGTAGARFGPVRRAPGAIGVSQRAFVEALAGLWLGAGATTAAAEAIWRRYHGRRSARRRGLDAELDSMRRGRPRTDELMEVARKLD